MVVRVLYNDPLNTKTDLHYVLSQLVPRSKHTVSVKVQVNFALEQAMEDPEWG